MTTHYLAIDQYGTTYHDLGPHPRKALLDKLGRKHAHKMYVDTTSGESKHVGWVIGGQWLSVYRILPLHDEA